MTSAKRKIQYHFLTAVVFAPVFDVDALVILLAVVVLMAVVVVPADGVASIRYLHLIFSSSQNPMTQQVPVYNTIFCKIHWHKKPFHKLPSIPSIVTHGFPNWTFQARSVPFRTRALVRWRPCVSVGSAPIGWAPEFFLARKSPEKWQPTFGHGITSPALRSAPPHQGRCSSPPPVLPSGMAL